MATAPITGVAIVDWFLALLAAPAFDHIAWGYLIVLAFTVFENMFVVGSFTPGETIVIAAAFVASLDDLTIAGVWFASVLGTVIGSNLSYFLGRSAGVAGVRRFAHRASRTSVGRLLRLHPAMVDEVHEHFHVQGARTVFIARFAIGAKNFVPALAGAVRMPLHWFELYTLLGAVTYTTIMCAIGWFVGSNFKVALKVAASISWLGLVVLVVFIASIVIGRRSLRARRAARDTDGSDDDEPVETAPDFDDAE